MQRVVQAHGLERPEGLLPRSGQLLLLWPQLTRSLLLWRSSLSQLLLRWRSLSQWLLWRRSLCWLLLLLPVALVDFILDLIEETQRLAGRIACLKGVQSLLEWLLLLLLLRECLLLLLLRKALLLLREGLLLLLLRECLLLLPRKTLLLLLLRKCLLLLRLLLPLWWEGRLRLLEGLHLRINGPELGVAGKGGDRLPSLVQRAHLGHPAM